MVMKYPSDFMGNGRVLLPGGLAQSKDFGVILLDGRSPFVVVVVVLFCFSNSEYPQMRDSTVEPRGGAIGQPEIWLKLGPRDS